MLSPAQFSRAHFNLLGLSLVFALLLLPTFAILYLPQGAYAGSSCALPWGGTIADGQSATAFAAPSASDTQCVAQTRTCTNGTLSGTFQYQSCYGVFDGAISYGDLCPRCSLEDRNQASPSDERYLLNNDTASVNERCQELGFTTGTVDSTYSPSSWCAGYSNAGTKTWINSRWNLAACFYSNVSPVSQATCTDPQVPSCSVTFVTNPLAYGSATTLTYSSQGTAVPYINYTGSFSINNVGYETPNASGSFSVSPRQTTDYTGTVGNGTSTTTCPATLTVTPPAIPTATITAASTNISVGQSTSISATFSAGANDTLTADAIDSPVATHLTTTSVGSKSYTFTPTQAGTYTFYARGTTQYYTSWTTYASVSVTVVNPTPTCSVTLTPNPSAYASSGTPVTLAWSSSNATELYINNIGWVGATGVTNVASQSTTDYSCYGYSAAAGDGPWTSASLTVTPPPSPTATISASSTSIQVGHSTNVTADFSSGSGDQLIADNIDEPYGTGIGATTNPDASKTVTFTPSSAGTYTFYAMATTKYYSSWTSYASTAVTVTDPPPTATMSLSPITISRGGDSTLSWSSSNATSCTIAGIGAVGTSGSIQVSPSQTFTYGGSCTGPGGTSNFNAGSGSTLTVTCSQSWSCSGETIVQTNSNCSTTNLSVCASPQFCESGSSSCEAPVITFNPSGNLTGQLEIIPNLLRINATTTVDWNVSDAQGCTVLGSNGDSWSGLYGSYTSKPITSQTIYTLNCTAYDGNPNVNESETVNVTPVYEEK